MATALRLLQALFLAVSSAASLQSATGHRLPFSSADILSDATPHRGVSRRILATTRSEFLGPHNTARKSAGTPSLAWDRTAAKAAQAWAKYLATTNKCVIKHSDKSSRKGRGENIYYEGSSVKPVSAGIGARSVKSWMAEKPNYVVATNKCKANTVCGHYTQVVWKNSKKLGCGYASCKTSDGWESIISVCQYDPAGNVDGQKPF